MKEARESSWCWVHTYENGTVEMAMFFAKKKKKKRGKFLISHNLEMNLEYVKGAIKLAFNPRVQKTRASSPWNYVEASTPLTTSWKIVSLHFHL